MASLETVSPQNSATATTSRKLADTDRAKAAKFRPLSVARSEMRSADWPCAFDCGPNWNAITRIHGSASSSPNATIVRLRLNCLTISTRSGSVRFGA